jgi:hypothetical protein
MGGPGNFAAADNIVNGADGADGSGGGGCFISAAGYGFPGSSAALILILLLRSILISFSALKRQKKTEKEP